MIKKIVCMGIPAILFGAPLTATLEDEASWLKDETFVISASRVKESINKASASITVIDDDTITKMGANTLLDVLRVVPGLGVSQSNIYADKINVRGIETWFTEKVLILLDGHSLNSDLLNGGAANTFANFPLEHIKRIEIIKGPASALYGENAFTALINIITKEAKEIDGVQISAKTGSDNMKIVNLLLGKTYETMDVTANINYRDTDGYKAYIANDAVGNSGFTHPDSKRLNTDVSIKHENGFYAKANYNTAEDGSRYGIAHALNDQDKSKREAYFLELGYKHQTNSKSGIDARIYHDSYEYDNKWQVFPSGFPNPIFMNGMLGYVGAKSKKMGAESLFTYKNEGYTVVSGISYEKQMLKDPWQKMNWNPLTGEPLTSIQDFSGPSTNYIDEVDRSFWAIYSELLYDVKDNLRLTAGARYDHYSDFGGVWNPRLGAVWEIDRDNIIKVIYGEAFRAPTFAELYNKNNPALVGNPLLNPEKVKMAELNVKNTSIDNLEVSLTLFNSTIDDLITIGTHTYINQGKTTTKGMETQIKYNLNRGSYVLANYTCQKPKNYFTSHDVENISHHQGYLALNYRINAHLNLYTDARYRGKQTRNFGDTRSEIESAIIANATVLIKDFLSKQISMKFSIYNLLDETTYQSNFPYDYPLPGRSYMAELSYKF